jgi:hypothetical protein
MIAAMAPLLLLA